MNLRQWSIEEGHEFDPLRIVLLRPQIELHLPKLYQSGFLEPLQTVRFR